MRGESVHFSVFAQLQHHGSLLLLCAYLSGADALHASRALCASRAQLSHSPRLSHLSAVLGSHLSGAGHGAHRPLRQQTSRSWLAGYSGQSAAGAELRQDSQYCLYSGAVVESSLGGANVSCVASLLYCLAALSMAGHCFPDMAGSLPARGGGNSAASSSSGRDYLSADVHCRHGRLPAAAATAGDREALRATVVGLAAVCHEPLRAGAAAGWTSRDL